MKSSWEYEENLMEIKVGLVSLGCPKNLVDSENMLGLISENNFSITAEPQNADVIIVNTCGFIESAKEESIQTILQMATYKESDHCKKLIIAGCLGERYADELLEELPEVDAIMGSHAWHKVTEVINRTLNNERFVYKLKEHVLYNQGPRLLTTPKHTAYLKIAEGCDNACSYCIIPFLRGRYKSRPMDSILQEAKSLALQGTKELILVAQDVTRYGEDFSGKLLLAELLKQLAMIDGIEWIRIMYAYPQYITDELIDTIATEDKICNYLDIPLQHASSNILKLMGRPDSKESITLLLEKLRNKIPSICIRTTFIVGFPGETEKDFVELKEFLIKQRFDRVGIFTYSQEEGTRAAKMPQIEEEIKEARYHDLMALQAKISEEININLENKEILILVEGIETTDKETLVIGRSYREAPEIDGIIYLEKATGLKLGMLVKCNMLQGFTYDLVAEPINP